MASAYVDETGLEWPLLLDEDRELYQAYGLLVGSWWALYNPISILKYLRLIGGGRKPGKPGRHWNQLGGNILIDPAGIVRWIHRSENPHDRPDLSELLTVVERESNHT